MALFSKYKIADVPWHIFFVSVLFYIVFGLIYLCGFLIGFAHTESNPALAIYEYFDSVRSATVLDDSYGCSYVTPGPLQTIPIQSRHYSVPGYLSTNFICYSFVTLIRRTINSNQIHHHLPKFYHHLY